MKIIEWRTNKTENIESLRKNIVKAIISGTEDNTGLLDEFNSSLGYKRENADEAMKQVLETDLDQPFFISPFVTVLYSMRPPISENGIVSFLLIENDVFNNDGTFAYRSDAIIRKFVEYINKLVEAYHGFLEESETDMEEFDSEIMINKFFFESFACLGRVPKELVFPVDFEFNQDNAEKLYDTLRLIGIEDVQVLLARRKSSGEPAYVCVVPKQN